jgi:hypothetical protein
MADMTTTFEIDQTKIDAPAFPRDLSWWVRFVPMSGPRQGTRQVADHGRRRPARARMDGDPPWLT